MIKSKVALIALAFAASLVGGGAAQAGASTGTWKYSPQQIQRHQMQQNGYRYGQRPDRYGATRRGQPYRYGYDRRDRGNHYGWSRGRHYGSEQRYYR